MLKTAVLMPISVAALMAAFAAHRADEPYRIYASPATVQMAGAAAATLAEEAPAMGIAAVALPSGHAATRRQGPGAQLDSRHGPGDAAPDQDLFTVGQKGLVFVAHPHRRLGGLSADQARGLFDGSLNNWRQLGGPDAPIRLLRPGKTDDLDTLCRALQLRPAMCRGEDAAPVDDHRCQRLVTGDPFAIGVMSLAAAQRAKEAGAPLVILDFDGMEPTAHAVRAGDYPLTRILTLRLLGKSDRDSAMRSFWSGEQGKELLAHAGYLPAAR